MFLLIEHFNINIFNFNIIKNCVVFSFKIFFIIQYFLLFFLSFFYYFSKSVSFFCIYFDVVGDLVRIDFLKNIGFGLIYGIFIDEDYNEGLLKIK